MRDEEVVSAYEANDFMKVTLLMFVGVIIVLFIAACTGHINKLDDGEQYYTITTDPYTLNTECDPFVTVTD